MSKAPAFQFYPSDWLSSKSVMLMTPAEEGAYIRLLAIAWSEPDCGLPDDDDALATLSRLGPAWKKGSGKKIRKCFISRRGRLYNKRLLSERKKQEEWKKKSSEGGKKSVEVRRAKRLKVVKGGSEMVDDCLEPKGNISFSSSSSSSLKTDASTTSSRKPDSGASTTSEPATGSGDGKVELTQAYLNAVRSVRYWAVCEEEERAWFSKRIRDNPRYERLDLTSCLERWRNSRHGLSERRRQGKGMNLPPEPRNDLLTWLDRDLERLKEGNGGQKHDQRGDAADTELPRELFV